MISDHESVFRSEAFAECVRKHGIQHRFGAVGKHGSIAVTERAIKTLKYEWLQRVYVILGYRHLYQICKDYEEWYNHWRPHTTVQGIPEVVFQGDKCSQKINKDSKVLQLPIKQKYFPETRVSGFRLKVAA